MFNCHSALFLNGLIQDVHEGDRVGLHLEDQLLDACHEVVVAEIGRDADDKTADRGDHRHVHAAGQQAQVDRAGTLKAKAFTQTIDRFDENQGLQETGIGIYFKEDFNNFRDLRRRIRERFTNKKRKARREARRQAAREEKERLRQPADTLSALRPVMDKKDENN